MITAPVVVVPFVQEATTIRSARRPRTKLGRCNIALFFVVANMAIRGIGAGLRAPWSRPARRTGSPARVLPHGAHARAHKRLSRDVVRRSPFAAGPQKLLFDGIVLEVRLQTADALPELPMRAALQTNDKLKGPDALVKMRRRGRRLVSGSSSMARMKDPNR